MRNELFEIMDNEQKPFIWFFTGKHGTGKTVSVTVTLKNNFVTIIETNLDLSLSENPLKEVRENLDCKILVTKFYKTEGVK